MGLKLRYNLFYEVDHVAVYDAYSAFYAARKKTPRLCNDSEEFVLHQQHQHWTVLNLDRGWEWVIRREAQLYVSRTLGCKGFLIFVYDGDYWGYEFFKSGEVLDQFVQHKEPENDWFPGKKCEGNPLIVSSELPFLDTFEVASYLVRNPALESWDEHKRLNVPARRGDEFRRFDECAVLDFLRFLGIAVELRNHHVTLLAPEFRNFSLT